MRLILNTWILCVNAFILACYIQQQLFILLPLLTAPITENVG